MVTGYDHLLFLAGVIFFLYRMKDIGLYVSLFALGHSTTMLLGVYFNLGINSFVIDAIIGLSVVYKALDNMGAFQRWFGWLVLAQPRQGRRDRDAEGQRRLRWNEAGQSPDTFAQADRIS